MKVVEYTSWYRIVDETALRDYAIKMATEHGLLENYHERERVEHEDQEENGGKFSPGIFALSYLIEHGLDQHQDESEGFLWHSSQMRDDLSEEDLDRRMVPR